MHPETALCVCDLSFWQGAPSVTFTSVAHPTGYPSVSRVLEKDPTSLKFLPHLFKGINSISYSSQDGRQLYSSYSRCWPGFHSHHTSFHKRQISLTCSTLPTGPLHYHDGTLIICSSVSFEERASLHLFLCGERRPLRSRKVYLGNITS